MANTNNNDKITYSIVGRYMTGSAVSAYHLISSDNREIKATRELVCFLVGKGLIVNCKGQMNGNDIALRGVGISLSELPVKNERTGEISNIDGNRNTKDTSVFSQWAIVARLMHENKCVGYIVRNSGGIEKKLDRNTIIQLANEKKISNARINMSNNVPILRGYGVELDKLPSVQLLVANKNRTEVVKTTEVRDNMANVDISWYTVQKVMKEYDSKFIKDSNNNASGVYQYPVLELLNAHSARMYIRTEKDTYVIGNIKKGVSKEHADYGLSFTLSGQSGKINVVCSDVNYLAFNIHVLGFIGVTALMKHYKTGAVYVREFTFENKIEKLLWRETNSKKYESIPESAKENVLDIKVGDIEVFDKTYRLNMNKLSSLGIKKRYPTINMVASKKAKLIFGTSNGSYELSRIKYGINNAIGIAIEIKNYTNNSVHVITSRNMSMDSITVSNVSKVCCLALYKLEGELEINNIIIENEIEESVLSYDVVRK